MEKLRYIFTGDEKEIIELVDNYKTEIVPEVQRRQDYAKGNNPAILERRVPSGSPDNKTPISYARRMINLVTGYMYKPGLITYASENQGYLEALQEVFDFNNEPMQTEQIGRQTSVQGQGYELFYYEGIGTARTSDGGVAPVKAMPRFVKVPVDTVLTIYNFDIVPRATHFIRFYTIKQEQKEYIEVYDERNIRYYERRENARRLDNMGSKPHGFDRVPLVIYENNEDMIGDFSCVVPLIDAYDVLMSDSLNEFDRFAWAYLIMRGFSLTDEQAEKVKHKKAFSLLSPDDTIEFLTKDINHEFVKFMSEWVRGEIHRQSGIPNLDDYKFGGNASGETLSKWIYLMELFTDPKESYFKQALRNRIDMITANYPLPGEPDEIEIIMSRNEPDKSLMQADLLQKYSGHVTQKTLLENFADFVPDAEEEIEALKAEKQANMDMLDLDRFDEEEIEEDEEE